MKVRVLHKGVNYDADGKGEKAIAVGSVIEVEGDTIPAFLLNKVEPVDGKVFVTNPAKPLSKAEKAAAEKAERAELVESAKLLGVEVTDKMSVDEIKAAIENAGK